MFYRKIGGNLVNGVGRHRPGLLKGSVGIEAKKFKVLADVGMSSLAGRTGAAGSQGADYHRIADFEILDLFADGGNFTGHFVADNPMGTDAGVHRSVKNVQVRAANPTIGNPHLDFSLAGSKEIDYSEFKANIRAGKYEVLRRPTVISDASDEAMTMLAGLNW